MSGTTVNEAKLSLKLMLHNKTKKIVFAEADSAFADFIFHLLSLPLAKVVDLLKNKGMNGCLLSVFESLHSLESEYFDPNTNKDAVFKPNIDVVVPLLSLNDKVSFPSINMCPIHNRVSRQNGLPCPIYGCYYKMSSSVFAKVIANSSSNQTRGFVKAAVRYMVMDNLEVKPMTIAFLKYHDIDIDKLEEKAVQVGVEEVTLQYFTRFLAVYLRQSPSVPFICVSLIKAVEILKASLTTDAVLTTVFMEKAN